MAATKPSEEQVPFEIHPRVFAALGADLVTNDIVAVIELVKNAYDAFASRVDVRFGTDEKTGEPYLDIQDDGSGMDRRTIQGAWCVVATPYRVDNPTARKGRNERRVAGEKGLGRLSAARLGNSLEMLTRATGQPCWKVEVDWETLSSMKTLSSCFATCTRYTGKPPFRDTGTRVRILGLKSDWNEEQVADLQENLARLVSPFASVSGFKIHMTAPGTTGGEVAVEIVSPEFLDKPPYAIRGDVRSDGTVRLRYEHHPVAQGKKRFKEITLEWQDIHEGSEVRRKLTEKKPECGPFNFELRAWDIGTEDTQQIAERFEIAKGHVRKAIKAHKGISVYRDGILALPKSDDARDWLGLDLRRISRIGTRLSTSQIVGYVSITAGKNSHIQDTSDREGLVSNRAVTEFQEILKAIVAALEVERDIDRMRPGKEVRLEALLDGVSAAELVSQVEELAEEGEVSAEAVRRVEAFSAKLDAVRDAIKTRFVYYSRLATVGTIAQMLVHEIRNRTTSIARFLRTAHSNKAAIEEPAFENQLTLAESSVAALERLADTFAPLASRGFRRGRRDAILEESLHRCLALIDGDVKQARIDIHAPRGGSTAVAIDPAELDTIFLNLLLNAVYWIQKSDRPRVLDVSIRRIREGSRARVTVSDSGPGVPEDDAERIFLPGVTRKPGGIGMGLTVAAEIVSEHGGQLSLVQPGAAGGATFVFDVPVKQ